MHGITAPLELVISRSGLGRATLYRHFPDRASLALAVGSQSLDSLAELVETENGSASLQALFDHLVRSHTENPFLADVWRVASARTEEARQLIDRFCALFEAPIRQAIAEGTCRSDLKPSDMFLVMAMLGSSIREPDSEARHRMIERMRELIGEGLWPRPLS